MAWEDEGSRDVLGFISLTERSSVKDLGKIRDVGRGF